MKRLTILGIVAVLATLALLVGPAAAGENRSLQFGGYMSGLFVPDGGDLPGLQFYVFESAVGSIDKGKSLLELLGASSFSYATVSIYDMAVLPDPLPGGCDPENSSSSDYGHGTMSFGEGDLWLELKSGFSCFFFGPGPKVDIDAAYEIVGGTGLFENASGSLDVTVDGTIGVQNTMSVLFEGKVRNISDGSD